MEHAFNVKVAEQYGLDVATFLQNMKFWTLYNLANNKHIYDGHAWVYNTHEAFAALFPYWTTKQIRRILDTCFENELILKGNYNKSPYDRTAWYALSMKSYEFYPELIQPVFIESLKSSISQDSPICPKGQMQMTKWANEFAQMGAPIPYTIPNTKKKTPIIPLGLDSFKTFWAMYPEKKARKKCLAIWKREKLEEKANYIIEKLKVQVEKDEQWKQGFIPNPSTYLTGERWEDELSLPKPKNPANQEQIPVVPTKVNPEVRYNAFVQDFKHMKKINLIRQDATWPNIKEWENEGSPETSTAYAKKHNLMEVSKVSERP